MKPAGSDPPDGQNSGTGEGRDAGGRFTKGNPGGPGGSRRHAFELRQAAEEAVSPEYIKAIMKKATHMALQGDIPAMRLVLERTIGKPCEQSEEAAAMPVQLPAMRTPDECAAATALIIEAFTSGKISRDNFKILLDGVQLRSRTIEQVEFDQRLHELEDSVAERTGKPRRRR